MNITGGEKALIEIVRYLSTKKNIKQTIYTSDTGKKLYTNLLGTDSKTIEFKTEGQQKIEEKSEYIAYFFRILQQGKLAHTFNKNEKNIILSHEEFLPSNLLARKLLKRNPQAKWLAIYHMKSPRLFYGFEGEYTNKRRAPTIQLIRYKLEQFLFYKLTIKKVVKIITVNPIYEAYLTKKYASAYTLQRFGGEVITVIDKYSGVDKKKVNAVPDRSDLCFIGRFHPQKGVFELIDIVARLKVTNPGVKLAVIGGGSKETEDKLKSQIIEKGLTENIVLHGYISGDEKFEILAGSKVFVMPSYYESFGQVALEAMKFGIPVVAYDLPPFAVFEDVMVKVPILDNKKFAIEVHKLLNDQKYLSEMSIKSKKFASTFSWSKTGDEIYQLILEQAE
jgi:glycosyltransferase involved in cell wall biosynthesis